MRSTALLSFVKLLTTLVVTVVVMPHAEGSENRYQHSQTVMDVVERQCAEGIGNDAFCQCVIEALNMYVPPKYASIVTVSLDKGRSHHIFELHQDVPRHIEDQLDEATRQCREGSTDSTESQ